MKPDSKGYILYDAHCITFWKGKTIGKENQSTVAEWPQRSTGEVDCGGVHTANYICHNSSSCTSKKHEKINWGS